MPKLATVANLPFPPKRFLAKKSGLAGKTAEDEAKADMMAELAWSLVDSGCFSLARDEIE